MRAQRRYTVRVWDQRGAEGTYEFKARSRSDAIRMATDAFIEHSYMAGSIWIPRADDCVAEVIGIRP
jgi:hypothetical protein